MSELTIPLSASDDSYLNSKDKPDSDVSFLEETFADRLAQMIGDESVASFSRRTGIGESLLRKYLNGAQPTVKNLVILADGVGASIDWLAAGRLPRTRAELLSTGSLRTADPEPENDEFYVLRCYRQADVEQKAAIHALLEAIEKPGGFAWFMVGQAIAKIANVFPSQKSK